jgi:hypothetical protein
VDIASRANSGQWLVHERQIQQLPVKQRKTRGNETDVATISLARGVFGGDRHTKTETEREQLNTREFPKTLTPSVHQYHACPWTSYVQFSRSLAQHFLFETFLCFKINPVLHVFLPFFFVQHCLFLEPRFSEQISTWLNITKISFLHFYIKIWHILNLLVPYSLVKLSK